MKLMKRIVVLLSLVALVGCATQPLPTVRQQDLDAWIGQPVSALELHPFFITVPVVKTKTSDGTEIWNYVNGRDIGSCSGGGSVFSGTVNSGRYNQFTNCVSRIAACNNIFYIKENVVLRYSAVGSGGLRCRTMKELQPQFIGSGNFN